MDALGVGLPDGVGEVVIDDVGDGLPVGLGVRLGVGEQDPDGETETDGDAGADGDTVPDGGTAVDDVGPPGASNEVVVDDGVGLGLRAGVGCGPLGAEDLGVLRRAAWARCCCGPVIPTPGGAGRVAPPLRRR